MKKILFLFATAFMFISCQKDWTYPIPTTPNTVASVITTTIRKSNVNDSMLVYYNHDTRGVYRDSIQWGDGTPTTIIVDSSGSVNKFHKYAIAGQYVVRVFTNKGDSVASFTLAFTDSILSLSGINTLSRLQSLVLQETHPQSNIDVKNSSLKVLNLEKNWLTTADVSGNPNLAYLMISFNFFTVASVDSILARVNSFGTLAYDGPKYVGCCPPVLVTPAHGVFGNPPRTLDISTMIIRTPPSASGNLEKISLYNRGWNVNTD